MSDAERDVRVSKYLSIESNEECKAEITGLVSKGDSTTLDKLMNSRLAFGTAGLRGPMGAGYSRMNMLTVMQTTQGLAKYLVECFGLEELQSHAVLN